MDYSQWGRGESGVTEREQTLRALARSGWGLRTP